ncbi:hypothetical protein [Enterococcus casseliflavus]|uniref:hypothetical protein n=1 Tax=Enterococcus casseliflavus TaxID=37734 RepID=UPI003D0B6A4B
MALSADVKDLTVVDNHTNDTHELFADVGTKIVEIKNYPKRVATESQIIFFGIGNSVFNCQSDDSIKHKSYKNIPNKS